MSRMSIVSARFTPDEVEQIRRIAAERGVTVSAMVRQAALDGIAQDTVALLRSRRDALPTVPGIDRSCGNLGVHDESNCNYRGCGRPVQLWSKQAWDLEFAARDIESRLAVIAP